MKADEIAHVHKKTPSVNEPSSTKMVQPLPKLMEKRTHKALPKKAHHSARSISDIESDRLKAQRPDVWHKIQNWD